MRGALLFYFATCALSALCIADDNECAQSILDEVNTYKEKNPEAGEAELCAYLKEKLSKECLDSYNICREKDAARSTRQSSRKNLKKENSLKNDRKLKRYARDYSSYLGNDCDQQQVDCQSLLDSKYRTIDGSCNNLSPDKWAWGKADRGQNRLLYPDYNDELDEPRSMSAYGPLPNPRVVSNIMHQADPQIELDAKRSLFIMQMGQLLAHDVILTHQVEGEHGVTLDCCRYHRKHPNCLPIQVPKNDPFFSPCTCMNFTRSKARTNCNTGFRDQINSQTSYLDISFAYGVTNAESIDLRTLSGGLLKDNNYSLPMDQTNKNCKLSKPLDPNNYYCPKAGDPRVAETPGLSSIHTLWMRNHNWLAAGLAAVHPNWDDEKLYQEARKINIAQWQHIVYNEYLPAVIGTTTLVNNNMDVTTSGYKDTYSATVDATIVNSFGAAVLRYGHSLVPNDLGLANVDDETTTIEKPLQDTFFEPKMYFETGHGSSDNILKYTSVKHCALSDRKLQPPMQRFLFGENLDVASLNIRRGRDHGLPGYNEFREYCGLPRAEDFETGLVDHTPYNAYLLSQAYDHPDQIDLFTGHLSEQRLPDSQLGPTGQCIFTKMFKRLRDGDRFFYERSTSSPDITFTLGQLNAIKQVTMSSLFCLNTADKAGKRIQENMFYVQSPSNDFVNCTDVTGIDLSIF